VIIGEQNPHHYLLFFAKFGYNLPCHLVTIPCGNSPVDRMPVEVKTLDVTSIHTLNKKMVDLPL
jgi:hypothetical protein